MLEKEAELALTNNELAELEEYQVSRNYLISVFSLLIFTVNAYTAAFSYIDGFHVTS